MPRQQQRISATLHMQDSEEQLRAARCDQLHSQVRPRIAYPRGAHHSRWRRAWPSGHMPRSVCCKHCEDYALRATRPAPCVSMLKRRPIVGPTPSRVAGVRQSCP